MLSRSRAPDYHSNRRLILIVANQFDRASAELAQSWGSRCRILSCRDLSVAGWRHCVGAAPGADRAMIGGCAVQAGEISGVLTRTSHIWQEELVYVAPADRAYVSAEMSSFLVSWLSALQCPVLNRPVPSSLAGPSWGPEQWAALAAVAGMRVQPLRRSVRWGTDVALRPPALGSTSLTIVGKRCFGEAHPALRTQARRLADFAQVDLAGVHFSSGDEDAHFAGVNLFPPIVDVDVAGAVLEYFGDPGRWSLLRPDRALSWRQAHNPPAGAEA
jgi:hypothetical protein